MPSPVSELRTPEQIKAGVRKMNDFLRRRRTRQAPTRKYTCVGGPWHGEQIALRTGSTASLVLGPWRGHYVVERQVNPITGSDDKVAWVVAS